MKISALRILLCAAVAAILALNVSAQTQAGQIKAARIEGQVLKVNKDGTSTPIRNNEALTESDVVSTGKNSSVVLVFMNGSSIKLGPDSLLAIEEFKMDPLAEDINVSTLKAEPSVSKTSLNLNYGELVGDVKKLNTSSSYSIKTPVGAAGIRGTVFRIVYRPTSDGKAFFTVSTQDGRVVMEGVTALEIPIPEGQEVVVTVDVPAPPTTPGETPAPAATPVVVTQDIPPSTTALITEATAAITTTLSETVFTVDTKAAEDKAAADKAAAEKEAAEKAAAEKAAAEKAAAEKAAAEKAAADKAAADKAAADKAAADKAAADKAAADKAAEDAAKNNPPPPTPPTTPQPPPIDLTPGAGGT